MSFRIHRRDTEVRFMTKFSENRPLQSSRKVVCITTKKTRAPRDSSQPIFCSKWADRAQDSLNVVTPDMSTYTVVCPDRLKGWTRLTKKLSVNRLVN